MRGALVLLALTASAHADVDLFPKSVLESHAEHSDTAVPPDPAWQAVGRATFAQFAPTVSQVTSDSPPTILGKQLARRRDPKGGPVLRGDDATRATTAEPGALLVSREAQVDTAQAAYEEPVDWQRTELEVRVDATGTVTRARVTKSSGRATLDAAALDSVTRAARAATGLGDRGPMTATFVVESGVSVAMPARAANYAVMPRPKGAIVPVVRGRFGSGRTTEVTGPLQPRVRTRVSVQSLSSTD